MFTPDQAGKQSETLIQFQTACKTLQQTVVAKEEKTEEDKYIHIDTTIYLTFYFSPFVEVAHLKNEECEYYIISGNS